MKTNRTKYIATAVCIIVFITVVGVAYKNKYIFSNQQINNNSGDEYSINSTGIANNTNNNSQKKKIELNGEIKLDDAQIYHMNTEMPVKYTNDNVNELKLTVTDCSYSRNLNERYSFKTTYWNRYGKDTFNDDGTITGDYYYLYVDYTVSCKSGEHDLIPKSFKYVILNDTTIEYDDKTDAGYIYLGDYDGRFGKEYMISKFKEGDVVHFQLVYLVPDSLIDDSDKDICIYSENGMAGIANIMGDDDNAKNFVKLDIKK